MPRRSKKRAERRFPPQAARLEYKVNRFFGLYARERDPGKLRICIGLAAMHDDRASLFSYLRESLRCAKQYLHAVCDGGAQAGPARIDGIYERAGASGTARRLAGAAKARATLIHGASKRPNVSPRSRQNRGAGGFRQ